MKKPKITLLCKHCSSPFQVVPSEKHRKYCSMKCWGNAQQKVHLSDEVIAQIEIQILEPVRSNFRCDAAIARLFDVDAEQVRKIRKRLMKIGEIK